MTVITRSPAPWLPDSTPDLNRLIVVRALSDVGICEMPPGSNRSGRIDEYVRAVGSPLGSYWCAAALAAWWREAGAEVPPKEAGSCDTWMMWARHTNRWKATPQPGDAVLYGTPKDSNHCGVVVRISPLILTVEGNTSLGGYDRNGVAVDLKQLNAPKVVGYISPLPII